MVAVLAMSPAADPVIDRIVRFHVASDTSVGEQDTNLYVADWVDYPVEPTKARRLPKPQLAKTVNARSKR